MFEKEAEEYLIRTLCKTCLTICENNCPHAESEKRAFKDGAEIGYKKGFEECAKARLNVTTISDCPIKDEWHDLRKDPKDYPEKEKLGQTFIVAFAFNEQTQKYYSFDCAEYIDKGRFITHTINGSNENNGYKVIAWKEIE